MKTTKSFRRFLLEIFTGIYILTNIVPIVHIHAATSSSSIVNPLKTVSKLECRFQDFDDLSSSCKQSLPILETEDYKKYATKNGGYNDYTRYYTVLWGASYKYGWDVGFGGHFGTDIATSKGTPVKAMADGVVVVSKKDLSRGNVVTIEHTIRGKKVFSNYAHMSKIDVSKGTKVKAGDKIGEVGSTGNSTGNHLHFQIDLDTPFHPYYPDYKTCPKSYYDITEKGACFDDLKKNTIDPILFLETKGEVLDNIKIITTKVSRSDFNTTVVKSSSSKEVDLSIFDRTVYTGYSTSDIKRVQEIFKDLGEYKGSISGDYTDIEDDIIDYQLSNNIISSKSEYGAGRFGPKTRSEVKKDYQKYLTNGGTSKTYISNNKIEVQNTTTIEKISRTNILTRAEIEERELKDFLRAYNIDFKLSDVGGNIGLGSNETLELSITSKSKDKGFKGNTPLDITFSIDKTKVKVFPTKIYNFTDGTRDIKLTGLKEGNTTLQIKMGTKIIKTIKLRIYDKGVTIYPESSVVLAGKTIVLGETKKGIVLFKDDSNRKLVNIEYGSTFTLKGVGDTEVCIKSGAISDIANVYKKDCKDSDFTKEAKFDYSDTVAGLVIFDYRTSGTDAKIQVVNTYKNTVLGEKKFVVNNPKGLDEKYTYYEDVVTMLEENIATGIKKGYFLEDRGLTESDALVWIENTLNKLKEETIDPKMKTTIKAKIENLQNEKVNKYEVITRQVFLEKAYKYLSFDNLASDNYKQYRDLDSEINKMVSIVFDENTTWKDQFGENYFRPDLEVTRGEGAYFLNQIVSKQRKLYLVNR